MYLSFYGLREHPFNLTPDAGFLYRSRGHAEVLNHLLYGIEQRKGFILLTGEVGSGKTTLCRSLLNNLGPTTHAAVILNSFLSEIELLQAINEDLGVPSAETRKGCIDALNAYLLECGRRQENVVLIIDEAQNLALPVLEQIRMLSNLETEKEKLLQIVLVGQPELRDILASSRLRQLNQRITVRYHLAPLAQRDVAAYISHRLMVAGASPDLAFTESAVEQIFRFSQGIPRRINVVCDQALLVGYVLGSHRITRSIVGTAISDVSGEPGHTRRAVHTVLNASLGRIAAGIAVTLAASGAVVAFGLWHDRPGGSVLAQDNALGGSTPALTARAAVPATSVPVHTPPPSDTTVSPAAAVVPPEPLPPPPGRSLLVAALDSRAGRFLGQSLPSVGEEDLPPVSVTPDADPIPSVHDSAGFVDELFPTAWEAVYEILKLWRLPPSDLRFLAARFGGVLDVDLTAAAQSGHYGYLEWQTDLNAVQRVNLPVVVELTDPEGASRLFALLTQLTETTAVVTGRNGPIEISRAAFEPLLTGRLIYCAADQFLNARQLRPAGGADIEVRRAQDLLSRVGFFSGSPNGWYTPRTAEAVARFQQTCSLAPTGLVDGPTKLFLLSRTADAKGPRLAMSSAPQHRQETQR